MGDELGGHMVTRLGGEVFSAPALQEIPLKKNPEANAFAEKLLNGEIDAVVFLTGVGTRHLLETLDLKFDRQIILNALRSAFVVARGPKPITVLNELKVPVSLKVPEPNTWLEILRALDESERLFQLEGSVIAVQEYGVTNDKLVEGLKQRGAHVVRVPVYRWALPDDTGPLKEAISKIILGQVDVAIFTTATQVHHLFQLAEEMGLEKKLKEAFRGLIVSSIGPTCTEAMVEHGVGVDIQPESTKIGPLVTETMKRAPHLVEVKKKAHVTTSKAASVNAFNLNESVFMKACRLEKTPYTPVWLMRQAGRYMKDYRAIRQRTPFLELCRNKDLVAEITVGAQEKIKADAAIIFADLLLIVDAFGLGLAYGIGEGPMIEKTIRTTQDISRLNSINVNESLGYVFDAIRLTRATLKPNIPLLGFAGAPFTVASYMIEGGESKSFRFTKALMYSNEESWRLLLEKITHVTIAYLKAQVKAGVQAVQLFDSWVGCLSPQDYKRFVKPFSEQIINALSSETTVIHFGTGNASFLEDFSNIPAQVIGVDFRIQLDEAWKKIGPRKAIQGNLDPAVLYASLPVIQKNVEEILKQAGGRAGHIFNLGHGVLPATPEENVIGLIEMVHDLSQRSK
jgi:uroporphyrinogen decarboxylase